MKIRFISLPGVLWLLPAALMAFGPHPSLLRVQAGEEWYPVMGLKGGEPIYWNGKEEARLHSNPAYDIGQTDRFAKASVEIVESSGVRVFKTGFDFTLVASETIQGGFIVVVVYDEGFLMGKSHPRTQHVVQSLPELPAGKPVKVSIIASGIETTTNVPTESRLFFPLIFTAGGLEARTNEWGTSARYFHQINIVKMAEVQVKYLEKFAHADRAAMPFIKIPPYLPEGMTKPTGAISAILSVSEFGAVTHVKLPPDTPVELKEPLDDALQEWLFLPRLKAGTPVPCKVEVPVQF